jgi:transposase
MANVLDDEKKQQVLALGRLGWSVRRIEREADVRRETASGYLKAAGIAVRDRGGTWPKPATSEEVSTDSEPISDSKPATSGEVSTDSEPISDSKPATSGEVSTDSGPTRSPTASACEPYRDFIEVGVGVGRDASAIYQDLVTDHGFVAGYSSVKRFVRRLAAALPPEARVVIETRAGEEAQVDYGEGPMVRNPSTGKYRRTRLFVLTLAHSRKSVRLLVWKSSAETWARLHEESFRRLGGAVRIVVLDNLKEGVLTPDIYEPALNPLYQDVLAHYGAIAMPCRVRDPDRKGKVESAINHTQRRLVGLRFETIELAQTYLDRWDERWADTRIHGTTKRQVAAMFAEEKPHLAPLPVEPFRYYRFGTRTVHLDGHVEIDGAYYAPPPGWVTRDVKVQWDATRVRIIDPTSNTLLREHVVALRGGRRILPEDRPTRTPPGHEAVLARARRAGPSIGAVADAVYAHDPDGGVRRVLGLLSLVKRQGSDAVEHVAEVALEVGAPTYRFIKSYLDRHPPAPVSLRQIDPLIRKLDEYRDLINRITGGP